MKKWILGIGLGVCACVVCGLGSTELDILRELCESGDKKACATLVEKGDMQGLRKLCDEKVGVACRRVGYVFFDQHDIAQAKIWFEKGCGLNDMLSCGMLGTLFLDENDKQAFRFYDKACNGGLGLGCFQVGVALYFGKMGVAKDLVKAKSYYRKGCELNYAAACFNLGFMYANGESVAKNETKALDLYEKACKLGERQGCEAALFLNGVLVE
ncbi:tetratricopeptide repeat protein [Helicobacter canis]|uniref:beta-lactamase n=1 Tax=Helicobacter canis TaxID=29419 RepID=A0A5M9QNM4_9HELI|nr:tetratricopeptide repeat protein [Helicobacter canis]KAA8709557.1 sel1 repeat family protein [Helicobacter canis]